MASKSMKNLTPKVEHREEIKVETAKYLKRGGKITYLPNMRAYIYGALN